MGSQAPGKKRSPQTLWQVDLLMRDSMSGSAAASASNSYPWSPYPPEVHIRTVRGAHIRGVKWSRIRISRKTHIRGVRWARNLLMRDSMSGSAAASATAHGGLPPFHQTSICLTQSTFGACVVQIWSRNARIPKGTKPSMSTVWGGLGTC